MTRAADREAARLKADGEYRNVRDAVEDARCAKVAPDRLKYARCALAHAGGRICLSDHASLLPAFHPARGVVPMVAADAMKEQLGLLLELDISPGLRAQVIALLDDPDRAATDGATVAPAPLEARMIAYLATRHDGAETATQRDIAEALGVSQPTVLRALRRSGHPVLLTYREGRKRGDARARDARTAHRRDPARVSDDDPAAE